jgi:type II secretory pathway pseudopilin PulG
MEMLVVVLIVLVLMGLVLGALSKSRRSAATLRMKADFQAITGALIQYAHDFNNTYPMAGLSPNPNGGTYLRPNGDRVLALAMFGPQGTGFQVVPGGKMWGPYLKLEQFRLSGSGADILDQWGQPIEYYPKRYTPRGGEQVPLVRRGAADCPAALYDSYDGPAPRDTTSAGRPENVARALRVALGDRNADADGVPPYNYIDVNNETLAFDGPFILLSGGPDEALTEVFQADSVSERLRKLGSSDDVYNYDR